MTEAHLEESESDGISDIIGTTEYKAARPRAQQFEPWHLPRKQVVRRDQWRECARRLVSNMRQDEPLRYLGLPGADLLDLRDLHDHVCAPTGRKLRFVGFNRAAAPESDLSVEMNISLDEVRRLGCVDSSSEMVWDDFQLLAKMDSKAYATVNAAGPFDIVNLDLCDGFASRPAASRDPNYYSALQNLLVIQRAQRRPWFLFLTTRTGSDDIDPGVRAKLTDVYERNLAECESFRLHSETALGIDAARLRSAEIGGTEHELHVFIAGLCKWIVGLVGRPQLHALSLTSALGYRVYAAAPYHDLVSLAIRFDPVNVPLPDPIGIAAGVHAADDECATGLRILKRVAKRKCIDQYLTANADERMKAIDETAALLECARYSGAEYRAWLESGEQATA